MAANSNHRETSDTVYMFTEQLLVLFLANYDKSLGQCYLMLVEQLGKENSPTLTAVRALIATNKRETSYKNKIKGVLYERYQFIKKTRRLAVYNGMQSMAVDALMKKFELPTDTDTDGMIAIGKKVTEHPDGSISIEKTYVRPDVSMVAISTALKEASRRRTNELKEQEIELQRQQVANNMKEGSVRVVFAGQKMGLSESEAAAELESYENENDE